MDGAAVVISHTLHQPAGLDGGRGAALGSTVMAGLKKPSMKSGVKEPRNKPFGDEVSWAQFYYLDKFVAMVSA